MNIESGIPIPEARKRANVIYDILVKLKVGDSFLVDGTNITSARRFGYNLARGTGLKFTTRIQPDGSFRVWRTA